MGGYANGVAVQSDGKIVAAGRAGEGNTDFGVARFTPHGALDPTFGGDGRVVTSVSSKIDEAFAVTIQADGKIVLAGGAGGLTRFALVRYEPDGDLDPTFGGDGKVTTNFSPNADGANAALQGGRHARPRFRRRWVTTEFTKGQEDVAVAVAVQADGKVVASGVA